MPIGGSSCGPIERVLDHLSLDFPIAIGDDVAQHLIGRLAMPEEDSPKGELREVTASLGSQAAPSAMGSVERSLMYCQYI